MYLRPLNPLFRPCIPLPPLVLSKTTWPRFICAAGVMGSDSIRSGVAQFRIRKISGYKTELLEVNADDPTVHVFFIPGNPGVVMYYKDFVESLYEQMDGKVSITAVGHLSHSKEDWAKGRLFSLQEQIDHKIDFIREELQKLKVPMLLVGHSIGSYISLEIFKRSPAAVSYCIGLYPFLTLNLESMKQSLIKNITQSLVVSLALSSIVASLGLLPTETTQFVVSNTVGKSWTKPAVEATCSHLLKFHMMRNILFMAMTEFHELKDEPNWAFMRANQQKLAFLFGIDDHWGPLQMHGESVFVPIDQIRKQVPGITLSVEREGHTHAFCCTEAGSRWVAHLVATLIKNNLPLSTKPASDKVM
ncbi:hypothetical protein MLD38_016100 [Melastoma candidum]|uniref:Uncharacterized protein n=1 Tax=Melastoma candidum TaxID=119954 RepID=A0ACB9RLZ8_9MYRT|nr:hypothetical protein MLD38_016100 [Melastoma candidum]